MHGIKFESFAKYIFEWKTSMYVWAYLLVLYALYIYIYQGSKLRGAEGQNAPRLSPNAPRLLNLGAKFCYPIQPDICFEA